MPKLDGLSGGVQYEDKEVEDINVGTDEDGINSVEVESEVANRDYAEFEAAKEYTEQQELSEPVSSEDIKFVIEVMKKEAPYDETSIKQLFYGCCSAFTKLPIHHNINSRKTGSGKSYILILVSGYFPNKYVLSFIGMSDKALVHEQGIQVIVDEETGNTVSAEPAIEDRQKKIAELETKIGELEVMIKDAKVQNKKVFISQKNTLKKQKRLHEAEIKDICKNCEKLIILDNRIILMLDTAQEGLYNTLMSMMSQDTARDQIYQFTDKQGLGKLRATKNRLRGTPAIFTTQVIDDTRQVRYQEKNRRFIHVTPDTSSEKISSAKKLIGQRYGLLPEEYDEIVVHSAEKERASKVVSLIVDKLIDHSKLLKPKESGVKIPFVESINHGIAGNETEWSMTVMDRTIRYLAIITKVNMNSRPRIIDNVTGRFYPVSIFTDLKETLQLMKMASGVLRPYISYWYNKVFLPRFKELGGQPNAKYSDSGFAIEKETYVGLTTEQLANATFEVMKIPITTEDIRRQYLYPLSNLGIINIAKSSINRNELICFPLEDEGNIFNIFTDEGDLRLKITDDSFFPTRTLLEDSFRSIVKQDAKEGVLKLNSKFSLIDEDGRDITIDELIDRYLDDPETCFKSDISEQKGIELRALCMYDAPFPVPADSYLSNNKMLELKNVCTPLLGVVI